MSEKKFSRRALLAAGVGGIVPLKTGAINWKGTMVQRGADAPPPPAPVDPFPLWGAQSQQLSGENARQAMLRVEAAIGKGSPAKMEIIRRFDSLSAGPVWPTALDPLDGRSLAYSSRVDPITAATGSADARARTFFADCRTYLNAWPNAYVFWTVNHEPEREIQGGMYTSAQFKSTWTRLNGIQKSEFPHARLRSNLILMKYTLDAASKRNFNDYFIAADHDTICFDVYKFKPADQISFMIDPCVNKAKAVNKPWGITECGVDPVDPTTPGGHTDAQRSAALTALADYIGTRDPQPLLCTYFNSDRNVPGDVHKWSIADEPTMSTAWKNGITVT